jgi:hypothetical protein
MMVCQNPERANRRTCYDPENPPFDEHVRGLKFTAAKTPPELHDE